MSKKSFIPPTYAESLHVAFDKVTGVILATEKRWSLTGEYAHAPALVSAADHLIKRAAAFAGKQIEEIDHLAIDQTAQPKGVITRIDLRERKPVMAVPPVTTTGTVHPARLTAP